MNDNKVSTNRIITGLIRFHFEKREEEFKKICMECVKYFENQDLDEVAQFILAQLELCPTWTPQIDITEQ